MKKINVNLKMEVRWSLRFFGFGRWFKCDFNRNGGQTCNSSNTSRGTSSDFQTLRGVEIPRRSWAFFTNSDFQTLRGVEIPRRSWAFFANFEVFWNRRKPYLRGFERTSQTIPYSPENLGEIWRSFCNIFLRFPNIVHATDVLYFGFMN